MSKQVTALTSGSCGAKGLLWVQLYLVRQPSNPWHPQYVQWLKMQCTHQGSKCSILQLQRTIIDHHRSCHVMTILLWASPKWQRTLICPPAWWACWAVNDLIHTYIGRCILLKCGPKWRRISCLLTGVVCCLSFLISPNFCHHGSVCVGEWLRSQSGSQGSNHDSNSESCAWGLNAALMLLES